MADTYFILCWTQQEGHWFLETPLGFDRLDTVKFLAENQNPNAVAILRIARDVKPEDVTEDIAHEVVSYLQERDLTHDGCGYRITNDFLDEVLPFQVGAGRLDRPEPDRCTPPVATGPFD